VRPFLRQQNIARVRIHVYPLRALERFEKGQKEENYRFSTTLVEIRFTKRAKVGKTSIASANCAVERKSYHRMFPEFSTISNFAKSFPQVIHNSKVVESVN